MMPMMRLLSHVQEEVLFTRGNNGAEEPDLFKALSDADLHDRCADAWKRSPSFRRGMEQLCAEEGIPETTYHAWMVE